MTTTRTIVTATGRSIDVRGERALTAAQRARIEDIDAVAKDGVDYVSVMSGTLAASDAGHAVVYVGGRYSIEAQFCILVGLDGGVENPDDELVREYVRGDWR